MGEILPLLTVSMYGLGLLIVAIGSIWFYVEAFKVDIMWFLACLFIPFASLVFLFKYAESVLIPTGLIILGIFLVVAGTFLAGGV